MKENPVLTNSKPEFFETKTKQNEVLSHSLLFYEIENKRINKFRSDIKRLQT